MKFKKTDSGSEDVLRKDLKGQKMTEWDRKNIDYTIKLYKLAYPGMVEGCIKMAREETKELLKQRTQKDTELNMVRRFTMPQELLQRLKKMYPALIVDRGQFEQFLSWFPDFDLTKR